jgi:hypothetical protein
VGLEGLKEEAKYEDFFETKIIELNLITLPKPFNFAFERARGVQKP